MMKLRLPEFVAVSLLFMVCAYGVVAKEQSNGKLSVDFPFGNHMVLQQQQNIQLRGNCKPGAVITVEIGTQRHTTLTLPEGRWSVVLDPMTPGNKLSLKIAASYGEKILIEDILVGEVWFCSGQSNMEFRLDQSEQGVEAMANAVDEQFRLLNYHGIAATADVAWDPTILERVNSLHYFEGSWERNSPIEAAAFSAIAWHFGRELRKKLGVPVGLVQVAVGGAPAESFADSVTLNTCCPMDSQMPGWLNNDLVMDWCRIRAGKNISLSNTYGQKHPFMPSYIFDAGISCFEGFPVKGVIFYQGESNAHNSSYYQIVFPALVKSWRGFWKDEKLPFIFAQLSSIQRQGWELFRDGQRRMAENIPFTAMVVTSDLGDSLNVHPIRKREVGQRFALQALAKVYGLALNSDGPNPVTAARNGKTTVVVFRSARRLGTTDSKPLRELEVAGKDAVFHPAAGRLSDNKIIIGDDLKDIQQVRYGWKAYSKGNLINEDGLPASTFCITVN